MAQSRTTEALITSAVQASKNAGIHVGAVEVEKGGVVRIIAIDAMPKVNSPKGENTCDAILGDL